MTDTPQPESLELALMCDTLRFHSVAAELRRLHARVVELEAKQCGNTPYDEEIGRAHV